MNPLYLAERFVLRKAAKTRSALLEDLPDKCEEVNVLVGDVTHDGILYKQLSIKAKKYKYRTVYQNFNRTQVCFSKLTNEGRSRHLQPKYFNYVNTSLIVETKHTLCHLWYQSRLSSLLLLK